MLRYVGYLLLLVCIGTTGENQSASPDLPLERSSGVRLAPPYLCESTREVYRRGDDGSLAMNRKYENSVVVLAQGYIEHARLRSSSEPDEEQIWVNYNQGNCLNILKRLDIDQGRVLQPSPRAGRSVAYFSPWLVRHLLLFFDSFDPPVLEGTDLHARVQNGRHVLTFTGRDGGSWVLVTRADASGALGEMDVQGCDSTGRVTERLKLREFQVFQEQPLAGRLVWERLRDDGEVVERTEMTRRFTVPDSAGVQRATAELHAEITAAGGRVIKDAGSQAAPAAGRQ